MNKFQFNDTLIEEAGRVFSALGGPSRLKLLRLLMASPKPLSQGVLVQSAGLSQANTSKHLACLVQTGLVLRERVGNQVYYRLAGSLVADTCRIVKEHVVNRLQSVYIFLR